MLLAFAELVRRMARILESATPHDPLVNAKARGSSWRLTAIVAREYCSSCSSSICMPESPELHLSRRLYFVLRRSLEERQIRGPNRYFPELVSPASEPGSLAVVVVIIGAMDAVGVVGDVLVFGALLPTAAGDSGEMCN